MSREVSARTHVTGVITSGPSERAALGRWIASRRFHIFVTLAFNDTVSLDVARDRLRSWEAFTCRTVLGSRWMQKRDERPTGIFVIEHIQSNTHWHGALNIAGIDQKRFEQAGRAAWRSLVPRGGLSPAGSTDFQLILDLNGLARYISKYTSGSMERDEITFLGP